MFVVQYYCVWGSGVGLWTKPGGREGWGWCGVPQSQGGGRYMYLWYSVNFQVEKSQVGNFSSGKVSSGKLSSQKIHKSEKSQVRKLSSQKNHKSENSQVRKFTSQKTFKSENFQVKKSDHL